MDKKSSSNSNNKYQFTARSAQNLKMNKPSGRISPEENHKVFEMLGDRRQSLSTAVVQLLIASQSPSRMWQVVVTGVACFVKDSVRRGYFIQVRLIVKYCDTRIY